MNNQLNDHLTSSDNNMFVIPIEAKCTQVRIVITVTKWWDWLWYSSHDPSLPLFLYMIHAIYIHIAIAIALASSSHEFALLYKPGSCVVAEGPLLLELCQTRETSLTAPAGIMLVGAWRAKPKHAIADRCCLLYIYIPVFFNEVRFPVMQVS